MTGPLELESGYGYAYDSTDGRCSGGPQPGAIALRDVVLELFPQLRDVGIYMCRPSSGGGGLSTHGEGRGWDCGLPIRALSPTGYDDELGWRLWRLFIALAPLLGIQRVIFHDLEWSSNDREVQPYSGASRHLDHLHLELCRAAATGPRALTPEAVADALGGAAVALTDEDRNWIRTLVLYRTAPLHKGDTHGGDGNVLGAIEDRPHRVRLNLERVTERITARLARELREHGLASELAPAALARAVVAELADELGDDD